MQESKQDSCSAGYIQQARGTLLSFGMTRESLDIESRQHF
jgi:hypothetical protein